MYGNQAIDCDGAQMRAVCRQLATVVTVTGDVNDTNIDCIRAYARRFIINEKPFGLDLSAVTSFTQQGISCFYDIDEDCHHIDVEWAVIASAPVQRTLRLSGERETFPTADSVPEALSHFAERIGERRRLLPLLTKTA